MTDQPVVVPIIEVTLVYKDGSTWFAGQFNSLEAANAWANDEKEKPYWDQATQVQVVDKTAI